MSEKDHVQKKRSGAWKRVLQVLICLVVLGVVCYGALIGLVCYWEQNVPAPSDYDGMIVLGAQVLPDGQPSVQLRLRLDKAKEYYQINPCDMVVCGGQGPNEPAPEGDVMREILLAEGLPEAQIISDPHSDDTKQNIRNAWEILEERGCQKPLIITSDYHLPRALQIARDMELEPQGAGSLCRPELNFWLKNHMREALAWVKYWGIKYLRLPL
ncbi:MAG: YdcF family protein [Clostridia bacterium]